MIKRDGFVLLMVIAVLTAASAALVIASLSARLSAREVSTNIDLAKAQAAVDTVVSRAILGLSEESPLYADGRPYRLLFNQVQITYFLVDTRGLIDLNGADQSLLFAFFSKLGLDRSDADALADAILDWRDKDDEAHTKGAEKRAYQNAGLAGPANRPFLDVSELRGILGMTAEVYRFAAPYFTAQNGNAKPDPLLAPPLILDILPISPVRRNEILQQRQDNSAPIDDTTDNEDTKVKSSEKTEITTGNYLLFVEANLPNGTRQAMRLAFSTGPRPGEYAILSRRSLPVGMANQIYSPEIKNAAF